MPLPDCNAHIVTTKGIPETCCVLSMGYATDTSGQAIYPTCCIDALKAGLCPEGWV